MDEERKLAKAYHESINRLEKYERHHQDAINSLALAKLERRAADVTELKRQAATIEADLKAALQAATDAHRSYWEHRRNAMVPQLHDAAFLMRRFNRIAYAAGCLSHDPALSAIQSVQTSVPEIEDDVPVDGPDSELLGDTMGYWR